MKISSIAAVLPLAFAIGCGSKAPEPTTQGAGENASRAKLKLAVIPKGTTHEFWKSIHAGAAAAAEELGVEIVWKGPLKEDDKEGQVKVVEDFIVEKVAGIVLAPLDDAALRAPVADAVKSDIPVVIIDSGLKSEDYTSFVATDNFKGGQLAAKRMVELLGGKGKVVMMRYQMGSASTQLREDGFLDGLKGASGIEVVSSNLYGGPTTEVAQTTGENLIAPHKKPDGGLDIDGIFCPNESTTFGMLRVLQDAKLAGKVKFVGFDASKKLVDALGAGEIDGLILQNPYRMGYLGVKTIVAHLKGEKVGKRVDTGVSLATKENMTSKEIDELLHPKQL